MYRALSCLRSLPVQATSRKLCSTVTGSSSKSDNSKPWEDPWKHALPKKEATHTEVEELSIDWKYVERLMPIEVIPDVPNHESYPTPSGWRPPMNPPPELPYFVRRRRDHMFPLYLEKRRDQLNEKTLDFDYVELVTMKRIDGDVFACESSLRSFLESRLGHPVATHVDELKGQIRVKGADRKDLEAFLFHEGF